ncbi:MULTISPECIES: hypothetical protein [Methylocaldum]|jgi:hypothetical protein|uniref:hypothetical protein n=1 Tax=unclassified Methylocaldum TaxID=2622260 RepID=UPI000989D2A2|nr:MULTISPECIES: hypothetical protein [unclassified Methylocaldum]MBP1153045.1 hypothetical protein [Methylocaldum sp. RMAD-M]MVF23895.1 hypothetical protein [Methylocaldum sp. BRCS4]
MAERRSESAPSHWLVNRLTEKSTWSGLSLVVICSLVLLGLPIVRTLAWVGLAYGLYSMFSAD